MVLMQVGNNQGIDLIEPVGLNQFLDNFLATINQDMIVD